MGVFMFYTGTLIIKKHTLNNKGNDSSFCNSINI